MVASNSYTTKARIRLKENVKLSRFHRYVTNKQLLASRDRDIELYVGDERILSTTVPKTVFNPYLPHRANRPPTDAEFLTDLVLSSRLDLKGKDVIDLGCGCGIVGLACILQGASKVLFTDINPNIIKLGEHKLIRENDEIKVQDLLSEEHEETYDFIIFSQPALFTATDLGDDDDLVGLMVLPDLAKRCIEQACKVLRPGGTLIMITGVSLETPLPMQKLMMTLNEKLKLASMEVLFTNSPRTAAKDFLHWIDTRFFSRAPIIADRTGRIAFRIDKCEALD